MNVCMQHERSHVPLILIAFLSSSVFSFIGCQKQTDKKKEAQLIEANAEALLIPRQSDTEWLEGKTLSSIDSIIGQREDKNIVYIFNFFDCQTCVKEGFLTVQRINDALGIDFVKVISSRSLEVTTAQRQYQYKGYIYMDERDRIRKELKYAPTPMLLILDNSNLIKDAFIFDSSSMNKETLEVFTQKCISTARSVGNP